MSEAKENYLNWTEEQFNELPLFFHPFWLDAVAGPDHWDICLSLSTDGKPLGIWPYVIRTTRGFIQINGMPPLTPYLGPWLFYPEGISSSQKKLGFEERVLTELSLQLPVLPFFQQKCHPRFFNWLPLHWQGYRQTTRYTYCIHPNPTKRHKFSSTLRRNIRRSNEKYSIRTIDDPELFYRVNNLTFTQKGQKIPYDLAFFSRLDEALAKRDQREITAIFDSNEEIIGALYTVEDQNAVYYLTSGIDRNKPFAGAMPLLTATAIEKALLQGKTFDFEGSMIPGIERFFRSFGGQLTPYHYLTKTPNRLLEALRILLQRS